MNVLKNLLTAPFKEDNYIKFSKEFLKNLDSIPLRESFDIPSMFRDSIQSYTVYGKYIDQNGENILVLSVKVNANSKAIKAQRNFIAYLLENKYIDFTAALVAYFDDVRENWKLSFVTVDYELTEKGVKFKFKPAKRYSFLVGKDEPTKTYMEQLSPIYDSNISPTRSQLSEAFSVSRLSNDFYKEYKEKFYQLYDLLIENENFVTTTHKVGYFGENSVNRFATSF